MAAVFLCLQPWGIRATPPGCGPSGANRSAPTGRRCAGAMPSATPAVPGQQGHGAHRLRHGGQPVHPAAGDGATVGQCDEAHGPCARGGNRLSAPALTRTQPGPGHLSQPVSGFGTAEPGGDERALAGGLAAAASLVRADPDPPGDVAHRTLFAAQRAAGHRHFGHAVARLPRGRVHAGSGLLGAGYLAHAADGAKRPGRGVRPRQLCPVGRAGPARAGAACRCQAAHAPEHALAAWPCAAPGGRAAQGTHPGAVPASAHLRTGQGPCAGAWGPNPSP